jgi:hypothetical protein
MKPGQKAGRNEPCPCGSGKKYKSCCYPKDREKATFRNAISSHEPPSLKERSLAFAAAVREILGLGKKVDWEAAKQRISPGHVREISQVACDLWPEKTDFEQIIPERKSGELTAIYSGDPQPFDTVANISRFLLYSDHILVVDPFHIPWYYKNPLYNPIVAPEKHIPNTLKWGYFTICLESWVKEDLVTIIPNPGDFDPALREDAERLAQERMRRNPPKEEDWEDDSYITDMARNLASNSDDEVKDFFDRQFPKTPPGELERILSLVKKVRESDPLVMKNPPHDSLIVSGPGINFEMWTYLAHLLGAFPYTNLRKWWDDLSSEEEKLPDVAKVWSPLTRAFQDLEFRFLDRVDPQFSCDIRVQGRLENLRSLLRKIWLELQGSAETPYSEETARSFADELRAEYARALEEWKEIDTEWIKFLGKYGTTTIGGPAMVSAFVSGSIDLMVPGALTFCYASIMKLLESHKKRNKFRNTVPMSVFVDLARKTRARLS